MWGGTQTHACSPAHSQAATVFGPRGVGLGLTPSTPASPGSKRLERLRVAFRVVVEAKGERVLALVVSEACRWQQSQYQFAYGPPKVDAIGPGAYYKRSPYTHILSP